MRRRILNLIIFFPVYFVSQRHYVLGSNPGHLHNSVLRVLHHRPDNVDFEQIYRVICFDAFYFANRGASSYDFVENLKVFLLRF